MPLRLTAPVLSVDVGKLHQVDTRNAENLYNMWSVFSNCAAVLEEGPRYEYFCWRLWNRETFCCEPTSEANATTPSISKSYRSSEGLYADVPSLSGSCDSLVDEEAIDFDHDSADVVTPRIRRPSSVYSRSRGREKHITPDDLEKMVMTIKEAKPLEPLHITIASVPEPPIETADITPVGPTPIMCTPAVDSNTSSSAASVQPASSESLPSEHSTTSIVRGFSPSHVSSSFRSIPLLATPSSIPNADLAAPTTTTTKHTAPKKQPAKFALGGSSGEDSVSEQPSMETKPKKKPAVFSFGGSSNEDESSLPQRVKPKSTLSEAAQKPIQKPTSFQEEMAQRTIQEEQILDDDVFESDEDEIDESAIDEDDSSEWEDSVEDSGNVSIDEKLSFPRVDSRVNLTSRRSLITAQLHQSDRAQALINAASRSTPAMQQIQRSSRHSSPNGPSLAASPADEAPLMMKGLKPISEVPRSNPQPIIMTTTNVTPHQALSPRTTRRNMMSQELPPSLRQQILNERQQKVVNAVLFTRRHTSHDVANLKQYPEKVHLDKEDREGLNSSWNQYFGHGLGEYHSKGW